MPEGLPSRVTRWSQSQWHHCIDTAKKNSYQTQKIRASNNRPLADDQKDINLRSTFNVQRADPRSFKLQLQRGGRGGNDPSDRPSYPPPPLPYHPHRTPKDPSEDPTTVNSVVHVRPDRTPSHTLHAHSLAPSPSRSLLRRSLTPLVKRPAARRRGRHEWCVSQTHFTCFPVVSRLDLSRDDPGVLPYLFAEDGVETRQCARCGEGAER